MFAYNFTRGEEPAPSVPDSTRHFPCMSDDAQSVSESQEQMPLYFKEALRVSWAAEMLLDNNTALSCDYSKPSLYVDSI